MNNKNNIDYAIRSQNQCLNIAIIVPVYNVECYLSECLDSILSQTYKDFVIFAIDDGSTDHSGEILDRYALKDKRIIVIHKKNGGVSSARNTALSIVFNERSRFSFLYFIDPDDCIPQNFLFAMTDAIIKMQADMAMCPYIPFDKNKTYPLCDDPFPDILIDTDGIANFYFKNKSNKFDYGRLLGNKFFVLDSVIGMYFDETLKTAEDQDWFINILPYIKSCITVSITHYQYRLRKSSLSHSSKTLQGFETYSRILQRTEEYKRFSPFAQSLIYEGFINSLYRKIKRGFYHNESREQLKQTIIFNLNIVKEFKYKLSEKKNRRYFSRMKNWPFFLLEWYMLLRIRKVSKKSNIEYKEYFD
mgnify:CR=1 FL=1